tara:strand:+ start:52 stop:519 length:468 start_codon:yes stop_codon:yes gene_type:complete
MKLTKDIIRKLIKEELLAERNMDAYDMVDQYRELQRRLWYAGLDSTGEGPRYNLWRLQTVFNVSPEEAKAKVEKHIEEMSDAAKLSAKVIKQELEDTDKRVAFRDHIRRTVKDGFLAPLPQNQLMSGQDMWTPESGRVPDYEDYKKHLETKGQAK